MTKRQFFPYLCAVNRHFVNAKWTYRRRMTIYGLRLVAQAVDIGSRPAAQVDNGCEPYPPMRRKRGREEVKMEDREGREEEAEGEEEEEEVGMRIEKRGEEERGGEEREGEGEEEREGEGEGEGGVDDELIGRQLRAQLSDWLAVVEDVHEREGKKKGKRERKREEKREEKREMKQEGRKEGKRKR